MRIADPGFDRFAELFGGRECYAERPGDITRAVTQALRADVSSIIEIPVDPEELDQPARGDAVRKERQPT